MSTGKLLIEDKTQVYSFHLNGLNLQTGDLLCTSSGGGEILVGQFWRFLGRLVPGKVDHIAVYVGPGGACVEAGPRGVNLFTIPGAVWNAVEMIPQRGPYIDQLIGAAYPLAGLDLSLEAEMHIRLKVGQFCRLQAELRKPYNFNFLNADTDEAFYCSQLPYRAYLYHGINLNTGLGLPDLPGSEKIIFPQEIWSGCSHCEASHDLMHAG